MSTRPTHGAPLSRWIPVIVLLAMVSAMPARSQGVQVALSPSLQLVVTGAEFDVTIDVTQVGSPFNGFDAVVGYDPAALTFMPASPVSLQQGCLMTGTCSAACGTTFHMFSAAGDSLTITDILICDQIFLTGPGHIYKLHFKASTTAQMTFLRLRKGIFYKAGLYVNPVVTADAQVSITAPADVSDAPLPTNGLRVRGEPNPGRGSIMLAVEADAPGEQRLEVFDMSGRLVRRLSSGWQESGVRRVLWDGTDTLGLRARSGIYLVTLCTGDRSARARVTLLE